MNNELQVINETELNIFDETVKRANIAIVSKNASNIFLMADLYDQLDRLLTPARMKPIMKLQGSKIGFKTDKIYLEPVVKTCLMDAMTVGVLATSNQFNIIAGQMYITKEGFSYLLKKLSTLNSHLIVPKWDTYKNDNKSAQLTVIVKYKVNGEDKEFGKMYSAKSNSMAGHDAILGKVERKAKKDLYELLTGMEISDGDIEEQKLDKSKEIKPTTKTNSPLFAETEDNLTDDEKAEILADEAKEAKLPFEEK